MLFYFKYFDKTIFQFSLQNGDSDTICNIIKESINHDNINHLPIEFCGELSEERLINWLKHRTIPANRYYVKNFLSQY